MGNFTTSLILLMLFPQEEGAKKSEQDPQRAKMMQAREEHLKEIQGRMVDLSPFIGAWDGVATMNGQKLRSSWTGSWRMEGTYLEIRGLIADDKGKVYHEDISLISYDPDRRVFQGAFFTTPGVHSHFQLECKDKGSEFEWIEVGERPGKARGSYKFKAPGLVEEKVEFEVEPGRFVTGVQGTARRADHGLPIPGTR